MLECGNNFKGTLNPICTDCKQPDSEDHRLNHCIKYRTTNLYSTENKVDINDIYSSDPAKFKPVISIIEQTWNLKNAHGTMIK